MKLIFPLFLPITVLSSALFDSFFDLYKSTKFSPHIYSDIANTTWKEYFISEKISKLVKITPYFVDKDKDLDIFVQDSAAKLYWVSNIRGTSKDFKHEFISSNYLSDFVISNQLYRKENFYILAVEQNNEKIFKFSKLARDPSSPNITAQTDFSQSVFIDIRKEDIPMLYFPSVHSKIKSINMYEIAADKQLVLITVEDKNAQTTNLFKIVIQDESIQSLSAIQFQSEINIIGAYDMNNDGLVDILYTDNKMNLFILINDDPFYHRVLICHLRPIKINAIPRLFVVDSNRDGFPDIISADDSMNTIGIFFNRGKAYWNTISNYFHDDHKNEKIYQENIWNFIPLIDTAESRLYGRIKDFNILLITESKRLNFEIFALYGDKAYWFIEKSIDGNIDWSSTQLDINYIYCMMKCDIVIETQNGRGNNNYDMILDVDVNEDNYPEFILYSRGDTNLYYIKKYVPYVSEFGWQSSFWIYLMIFIYGISSLIGFFEFYNLKKLNDRYERERLSQNEEDKGNQKIELNNAILNN